ncbi:MAG: ACT domain-containing protein [Acidobacteria bacterium]|nr:ACT domain-containing protein [Acidobacteriota bacterium]
MAEMVQPVEYYYIQTANKPGEAFRALTLLKQAGVDLLAFSGFPSGRRSQLDFIPVSAKAFIQVARKAGWKLSPKKTVFLIQGEDRVGALSDVLGKLAAAKVNVTAVDAVTSGDGFYGSILWVKPEDNKRAAKALGV